MRNKRNMILLSFDIEEFDVPRENGVEYSLEEGMKVSVEGTERILDIVRKNNIRATFFCTANFAKNAPGTMKRILKEGHEVACHGVDHFEPKESDFEISKKIVEKITDREVTGYRQPRMFPVKDSEIRRVGYRYNSSLNPAFIPGRYMNLKTPRTYFKKDGVMQIPASVTPWVRFPLFWLSLHHLPESIYHRLAKRVLKHDGYFTTYFHPWEFYELNDHPEFKISYIIRKNSGRNMEKRLDNLINALKKDHQFITYNEFVDLILKDNQF